jgi:L-cysteine desulfidase
MEIDVKRPTNESAKIKNFEAHELAGDNKSVVVVTLIGDLKILSRTTETRLQSQRNRTLIKLKQVSSKSGQEEELFATRVAMDSETRTIVKIILKANTMVKIQKGSQVPLHGATPPEENRTRRAENQRGKGRKRGT